METTTLTTSSDVAKLRATKPPADARELGPIIATKLPAALVQQMREAPESISIKFHGNAGVRTARRRRRRRRRRPPAACSFSSATRCRVWVGVGTGWSAASLIVLGRRQEILINGKSVQSGSFVLDRTRQSVHDCFRSNAGKPGGWEDVGPIWQSLR